MLNTISRPTLVRAGVATVALGMTIGLAACGSSSSASSSASASASTSASSTDTASASASASASPSVKSTVVKSISAITATPATVGKTPTVTGKWPLAIASTQVKTMVKGTGTTVTAKDAVQVNYSGVDARTGKVFDTSFGKTPAAFNVTGVVKGFQKALVGQKVGSRVLVFMTGADGYGSTGQTSAGIEPNDSLIFVVDILKANHPIATKSGQPTVTTDAKNTPSVTIPKTKAPTSLVVQPLLKGLGSKVTSSTSQIEVNYRSYNWATGKLLQDDYSTGPEVGTLAQLVPAWQKGLVGQTVGSRVMIIAPPSTTYGSKGQGVIPANATIVYVVDILAAQ